MSTVSISAFSKELQNMLDQYGDQAFKALGEIAEDVAKDAKKMVKSGSPRRTGKYKSGWSTQADTSAISTTVTVYNKNKPGLPHLLEFGHALRGGGRTGGVSHIAPTEEWASEEVVTRLERELGQ